jgi:hypothetical protein
MLGTRSRSLHRLDTLKTIPAMLLWGSAEPLLGPIDFRPYLDGSFNWIITGCEQAGVGEGAEMIEVAADLGLPRFEVGQTGDIPATMNRCFGQHFQRR